MRNRLIALATATAALIAGAVVAVAPEPALAAGDYGICDAVVFAPTKTDQDGVALPGAVFEINAPVDEDGQPLALLWAGDRKDDVPGWVDSWIAERQRVGQLRLAEFWATEAADAKTFFDWQAENPHPSWTVNNGYSDVGSDAAKDAELTFVSAAFWDVLWEPIELWVAERAVLDEQAAATSPEMLGWFAYHRYRELKGWIENMKVAAAADDVEGFVLAHNTARELFQQITPVLPNDQYLINLLERRDGPLTDDYFGTDGLGAETLTLTSDENGKIEFTLYAGQKYQSCGPTLRPSLTEVSAPDGYLLPDDPTALAGNEWGQYDDSYRGGHWEDDSAYPRWYTPYDDDLTITNTRYELPDWSPDAPEPPVRISAGL